MPLTPADIHNVAFSKPPIGKRGYNEDEVDAFLDLCENQLTRLLEQVSGKDTEGEAVRARLLTDAQKKADALQADAERKHSEIMNTINQQRTVLEGRLEQLRTFERLYRTKLKDYLQSQLEELGRSAASASRTTPEGTIEQLQSFAQEYRRGLKAYLESQLEELGERGSAAPPAEVVSPRNAVSEADAEVDETDVKADLLREKLSQAEAELESLRTKQSDTQAELESLRSEQSDAESENRDTLSPGPVHSGTPTVSLSSPVSADVAVPDSGIFISYRRDDERSFAGRLYDRLSTRFGDHRIFMDVDSIELGLDFTDVIEDRLEQSSVVLVVMGRQWLECSDADGRRLDNPDDFVRLEVETALARRDVRVIPILVDEAAVPKSSDLPLSMRKLVRRSAIRMSHEGFGADFGRLLNALESVMSS